MLVLICSSIATALDSFENITTRIALKLFDDCATPEEFLICLKKKAATVLDGLKRVDQISFSDNVKIVRVVNRSVTNDELTEGKLDEILPATREDKHILLNQMISEELMDIFKSSSLEISLPKQIGLRLIREGQCINHRINFLI